MARLAPALKDIMALADEVRAGNVAAGVELARKVKANTAEELLRAVWTPGKPPSVPLFDVCADAISLKNRVNKREGVIQ